MPDLSIGIRHKAGKNIAFSTKTYFSHKITQIKEKNNQLFYFHIVSSCLCSLFKQYLVNEY